MLRYGLALFILALAATWPCAAQVSSPSGCPVQITEVRNIDTRIMIFFANTGGKPLQGYEFGLRFYDTDHQPHDFPTTFSALAKVMPKAHHVANWKSAYTLDFLYPVAQAYLLNATFTDGSTWSDDGSHSCSGTAEQE